MVCVLFLKQITFEYVCYYDVVTYLSITKKYVIKYIMLFGDAVNVLVNF